MIPFGALVYFKPSGARHVEQKHKFDIMGIPGVLAGYDLAPGLHWSRKYRVWALADWSKQAYDTSAPILKLKTPHCTERVELKEPLEFPCKVNYEKISVTIDGLKEKDRLDGSPDYLPLPPRDDDDDDDDDDDQDGGSEDGPDCKGKVSVEDEIRKGVEELEMEGAIEAARRADLPPPPWLEQVQHDHAPRIEVPDDIPEHDLGGEAGDGKVYLNDDGEKVKIDKRGRPYRIDERGFKKFHNFHDLTNTLQRNGGEFRMKDEKRLSKFRRWKRKHILRRKGEKWNGKSKRQRTKPSRKKRRRRSQRNPLGQKTRTRAMMLECLLIRIM